MDILRISSLDTLEIRHKVLWPNKHIDFCKLDDDSNGLHYGGFIKDQLICVASVFIEENSARLRKFATLPQFQKLGYGSIMLNQIIKELEEIEIKLFWCDARSNAKEFYNRFGMIQKGETFLKSGVEYVVMEREFKSSL